MSVRRVALVAPVHASPHAGNTVTAERIARGLAARGVEVAADRPDVVHALHLRKSAAEALCRADAGGAPIVATATGTDLATDLADPAGRAEIERLVARARVLTAFHAEGAARLALEFPDPRVRKMVVPHAATLERDPRGDAIARARLGAVPEGEPLFLWLGGLRAVKAPYFAVAPIVRLRRAGLRVHLAFAGPVLEPAAAVPVAAATATYATFIHALGEIPRGGLPALFERAAVLVNTSLAEGMSNAILEAMLAGVPVLARDIEGNRAAVREGREGLLFADEAQFEAAARRLAEDAALRRALGEAGRARAREEFSEEREIAGYLAAYEAAVEGAATST